MKIISNHLNEFYLEYADDTGLSLSQTSRAVNTWDTQQFQDAINELLGNMQPDDTLTNRLQILALQANQTKRSLMGAMIGAGMAVATAKTLDHGTTKMTHEYVEGRTVRGKPLAPQQPAEPIREPTVRVSNTPYPQISHAPAVQSNRLPAVQPNTLPAIQDDMQDFNDRMWAHNDVATSRMQQVLDTSLRQGVDGKQMHKLTKVIPHDGARPTPNLSTEMNKVVSSIQGLVVDKATRSNSQGQREAYEDQDVEYVYFMTQNDDRVCDLCDSLVGMYPVDEAPAIPDETHPGCRCQEVPCDADGNILPGFAF